MNEKEIIELANSYFFTNNEKVIKNIGDDCAVTQGSISKQLFTSDMLIEGTHFLFNKIPAYSLGWKSLAVNISDIASMGGIPEYALLSLGISKKVNLEWLNMFYKGLADCATKFSMNIIGGDTVKAPFLVINIALNGSTDKPVYRDNIQDDYILLSTGYLGMSGAGFWCIQNNENNLECIDKHYNPQPRVNEGLFLAENLNDISMMDSSDGLYKSVETMCEKNNLGIELYFKNLDIHPELNKVSDISGISPEQFILYGGEDYELIFSISENDFHDIKDEYYKKFGFELKMLGRFTAKDKSIYLNTDNEKVVLNDKSFNHFK